MKTFIGYTRTPLGWINATTAAGSRYNINPEHFAAVTGASRKASAGYIEITADQWRALKADRWTRRIDAVRREEVIA